MLLEPPIDSVISPYRRLARKAGICRLKCSECDCPALVACVLSDRIEMPRELIKLEELPTDILTLIRKAASQIGEVVSEPDDASEHVQIRKDQTVYATMGSDDEL